MLQLSSQNMRPDFSLMSGSTGRKISFTRIWLKHYSRERQIDAFKTFFLEVLDSCSMLLDCKVMYKFTSPLSLPPNPTSSTLSTLRSQKKSWHVVRNLLGGLVVVDGRVPAAEIISMYAQTLSPTVSTRLCQSEKSGGV